MKQKSLETVLYQGRYVPKNAFRAFVYNSKGQMLAQNYQHYQMLIDSKEWFSTKAEIPKPEKVKKHDIASNSLSNG